MAICTLCRVVWTCSNTGTCRACRPEYHRRREAQRIARERSDVLAAEERESGRPQPSRVPTVPRPRRTVLIDGTAFEVAWDGSIRPPEAVQ